MSCRRVKLALSGIFRAFTRAKTVDPAKISDTELRRCLGVIDLTSLGIGSTLGAGCYVIMGHVAKNMAGPAVVISVLIAAVASLLSGLCYSEFAARVPKAGSAYVYSYVSVGELLAFVIGWNMILEHMIGAATVAKAWSQYLDSLMNNTIRTSIEAHVGYFHNPGLAQHPDFLAFGLLLFATIFVCVGVKMSAVMTFVLTILNLLVLACVICVGFFHSQGANWTSPPGFFPYGYQGVMRGAATCFYVFVGFDNIASSAEEARKPSKIIPTAIIATLIICFLGYFGVSAVLTLMVPFHQISDIANLPNAFAQRGIVGAEFVITAGGFCGLMSSMIGSLFPLPRTIYAMAQDGLLFRFLGLVNARTSTPVMATIISGFLAAVLSLLLRLQSLVELLSIGTLMAYSLVACGVLILRYHREDIGVTQGDMFEDLDLLRENSTFSDGTVLVSEQNLATEDTGLLRVGEQIHRVKYVPSDSSTDITCRTPTDEGAPNIRPNILSKDLVEQVTERREKEILYRMEKYMSTPEANTPPGSSYHRIGSSYSLSSISNIFNFGDEATSEPSEQSLRYVLVALLTISVLWASLCALTVYGQEYIDHLAWWTLMLLVTLVLLIVVFLAVLSRQPRNKTRLIFKVPFVPFVPLTSIMINIYLMMTLPTATWLRFAIWMTVGFVMYLGYGIWNSTERRSDDQEVILYDISDREGTLNNSPTG